MATQISDVLTNTPGGHLPGKETKVSPFHFLRYVFSAPLLFLVSGQRQRVARGQGPCGLRTACKGVRASHHRPTADADLALCEGYILVSCTDCDPREGKSISRIPRKNVFPFPVSSPCFSRSTSHSYKTFPDIKKFSEINPMLRHLLRNSSSHHS